MQDGEYSGASKRDIVHRAASLAILVILTSLMLLGVEAMQSWRLWTIYVFATALIWFPETFASVAGGYQTEVYFRLLGWLTLILVPVWIAVMRWIAWGSG